MGVRDLSPAAVVRRGPTVRARVEWSDVDAMQIAYYGSYLRYMEAAESALFRAIEWPYERVAREGGVWIARVRLTVDYQAPARMDDEIDACAEVLKLGASSIHVRFPIVRADGTALAESALVLACLDRTTLKSTRIPRDLRAALAT